MFLVIIESIADAFLTVGVLVAGIFVLLGIARMRWGDAIVSMAGHRRWGPAMASILTLPPGCIGVLVVCRLYGRGSISYGTAIAALVSTMGDAAWLLLATHPQLTLVLKAAFMVIGIAVGHLVDGLHLGPALMRDSELIVNRGHGRSAREQVSSNGSTRVMTAIPETAKGPEYDTCDAEGSIAQSSTSRLSPSVLAFWSTVALGLLLAVPVQLHLTSEEALPMLRVPVGMAGFLAALAVFLESRCRVRCGEEHQGLEGSLGDVMRFGASEAAFVTFWVAVVFTAWDLSHASDWPPWSLPVAGLSGVVVGALAGLIPACGVEILMASLFVSGGIPLPTLVAYLLSQDGNGLIPIASRRPKAALHAAALTTIPALIVGGFLVFIR